MKNNNLNPIFSNYARQHLSPKEDERTMVSKAYEDLCGFLKGKCFQSGSYARFTSTTPVNDLDVIWIIPQGFVDALVIHKGNGKLDPNHLNPSHILEGLSRNLVDAYKKVGQKVRIKPQSHSIGVYFGDTDDEFSMDIVPAIITGEKNSYEEDIYWVPQIAELSKTKRQQKYHDGESIDWIKSDPRGYVKDVEELNAENEDFRKASKFVRKWRRACKSNDKDFPLKSFHLELIMNDIFREIPDIGCFDAVNSFFLKTGTYLTSPNFVDRADDSRFIDSYVSSLTEGDREKISLRLSAASDSLANMMSSPDATIPTLIQEMLSGGKVVLIKGLTEARAHEIVLGDTSHKKELSEINVFDSGSYPCEVKLKASLYFRGPKDRDVNIRFRGTVKSGAVIPTWHEIHYEATTNAPGVYEFYWQVVNTGKHAHEEEGLRGGIDKGGKKQVERSLYTGKHWIECFIITQEGVCIARSNPFYVTFLNPKFPVAMLLG